MPHAGKPGQLPKPHTIIKTRRGTLRFYLGDCLDVLSSVTGESVSAVVTSPPYNLGVRYRSYHDSLPREHYLEWTAAWIRAVQRVLEPDGSLFLNVGAKPTDPWTALDVAQAARPHLELQNTIHWIKSIAIDRDAAGVATDLDRDIAVGHYKPINSSRFVNDCHEFEPTVSIHVYSPELRRMGAYSEGEGGTIQRRPLAYGEELKATG
jgi:site-specific DNA-methyltransferase (adenine-specific)